MSRGDAAAQALEGCSPESAGRPLEAPGDGVSRWMVAASPPPRRWRGTESGLQASSSALRPSGPPDGLVQLLQCVAELVLAALREVVLLLIEQAVGEGVLTGGVGQPGLPTQV
jgi:hypothetical protein